MQSRDAREVLGDVHKLPWVLLAHFLPEDVHLRPMVCVFELELVGLYDML